MAIPNSRMSVSNASALGAKQADFLKVNESSVFNITSALPQALNAGSLVPVMSSIGTSPSKILGSLKSLGFSKQISSLDKLNMSISTATVMNKLKSVAGTSIGNKYAMNTIFGNCPYDNTDMNMMNGLYMGLLPSMAARQKCSNGMITSIMGVFGTDLTPNTIGKNLGGIAKNVKAGKGTSFLTDLNLNSDLIGFKSSGVNPNNLVSSIVSKSDLAESKQPKSAFGTMIQNMNMNDMTFNGNEKVYTVAKKASMDKSPTMIDVSSPNVNRLSTSDLLASKSYIGNSSFNLFG